MSSLDDHYLGERIVITCNILSLDLMAHGLSNVHSFPAYNYTDDGHLPYLMTALQPVHDWINLGVYLGVPYATLKKIEREQEKRVEDCKREMLVAWLKSSEVLTKYHLMNALWNINHTQTVSDISAH